MNSIGPIIAASGRLSCNYADMLLAGIPPHQFARFATPGGQVVQSNHPAFIIGHLSIYFGRIAGMVGVAGPANPAGFDDLFKNGAVCRDDPDGAIYPSMAAVVSHFRAGSAIALTAIGNASDADLVKPNPAEGRMKELFPTVGAMSNFLLGGHAMSHLGQLSAWRRCMGLPSVM